MALPHGAIVPGMLQNGSTGASSRRCSCTRIRSRSRELMGALQLGTRTRRCSDRNASPWFTSLSGAVASIASSLFTKGLSVGASGAILGIAGIHLLDRRSPQWRHEPWTKGLIGQLIFWAVVNIALGFSVKYIDNVAHIAGLVTGLILGFIPHRVPPPPPSEGVIDVPVA